MLRPIIVAVGVLLIASPTWAADHWQRCKDAFEAGTAVTQNPLVLSSDDKESWCFDSNGTAEGNMVDGRECEYVDVKVHCADATGGACAPVDIAVTWNICPTNSKTTCAASITSTGVTGIDHQVTTWPNSFSMQYGYPDIITNTNSDDLRTEIRCYKVGD